MGKAKLALAAISGTLILAGCATTPAPAARAPAFSAAAFQWSSNRGGGRIEGRLDHGAYSCQGAGVVLTPETPWVRNRMQTLYLSTENAVAPAGEVRRRMPGASPSYDAYVRRSPCDAQNRFSFAGLPDGAWYVITSGQAPTAAEPLAFMRRVVIRGGAAVLVVF